MHGASRMAMLGALLGLSAFAHAGTNAGPVFTAPAYTPGPSVGFTTGRGGYRRKDRHNTAAQVKRASIKARNVSKHRGRK